MVPEKRRIFDFFIDAVNPSQQCGFACPRGAEQTGHAFLRQVQIDIGNDAVLTVIGREIPDLYRAILRSAIRVCCVFN